VKADILARYADLPLPRYTSYPTAPHFQPVEADLYRGWLATLPTSRPASLYLHVPFCRSMCWYCGCHTTITARDEPIARYLDALEAEIDLVADTLPARLAVGHVHFGGGTPTLMHPAQFVALMAQLRGRFALASDTEIAIEIDPRTLEPEMVAALAKGGVTRASLGVQTFDPVIQKAINRIQSHEQTAAAVAGLRSAGIGEINFDLIYGLPHQTINSCAETVAKAVALAPDRLAVFGYAHVPSFKLHQRKIEEAALPDGSARHAQAEAIAEALVAAGYVRIGLDHFARPDDPLTRALEQRRLHRNFQGYTTDECETLIGFGASSIGRLPQGYVQNAVLIGDYQRRIAAGQLAVSKGCTFAAEDRLRAAVIERLMCDYRVDLARVCAEFGADPERLVASAAGIDALVDDGLAERHRHVIAMREEARPLVRVLASAFDQYLGQGPARHSRAV
jgi:oxygen-independent coproporphyrinogen-3 oxidase